MYCICCDKDAINPISDEKTSEEEYLWETETRNVGDDIRSFNINNRMISNGIAHIIDAGYGSTHDGDQFIIAICDECITKKVEDGSLLYWGNYMSKDQYIQEDINKSKKAYKRRKNLDGLV